MDCIIPFGPLIYQNDISKEFHNFLLDNLDHSKEVGRDSRDTLAVESTLPAVMVSSDYEIPKGYVDNTGAYIPQNGKPTIVFVDSIW